MSAGVSDNIVALRTQADPEAEGIVSIRRDIFQIEQQFSCGPERPPDSAHGSRRLPWVRSKEEPGAPAAGAGDRSNGFSHPLRGAAVVVECPHGNARRCHGLSLVATPGHDIKNVAPRGLSGRPVGLQ